MGTPLHRQPQHLSSLAARAATRPDPKTLKASILVGGYLVIWFLWRGETPKARGVVDRIAPWIGADMSPLVFILWSCAVALYHSVHGEVAACRAAVDQALALARSSGLHGFDFLRSAQLARRCLVAGEPALAEAAIPRWGRRCGVTATSTAPSIAICWATSRRSVATGRRPSTTLAKDWRWRSSRACPFSRPTAASTWRGRCSAKAAATSGPRRSKRRDPSAA